MRDVSRPRASGGNERTLEKRSFKRREEEDRTALTDEACARGRGPFRDGGENSLWLSRRYRPPARGAGTMRSEDGDGF